MDQCLGPSDQMLDDLWMSRQGPENRKALGVTAGWPEQAIGNAPDLMGIERGGPKASRPSLSVMHTAARSAGPSGSTEES